MSRKGQGQLQDPKGPVYLCHSYDNNYNNNNYDADDEGMEWLM